MVIPINTGVGSRLLDSHFTQDVEIPWEVDDFRASLAAKILPAVHSGSRGRIEVRVSESPQIRDRLRQEIESALRAKGADPAAFDIRVLSAYKQGYSWLHDAILPRHGHGLLGEALHFCHEGARSEERRARLASQPTLCSCVYFACGDSGGLRHAAAW